jgi:hypothetical protein
MRIATILSLPSPSPPPLERLNRLCASLTPVTHFLISPAPQRHTANARRLEVLKLGPSSPRALMRLRLRLGRDIATRPQEGRTHLERRGLSCQTCSRRERPRRASFEPSQAGRATLSCRPGCALDCRSPSPFGPYLVSGIRAPRAGEGTQLHRAPAANRGPTLRPTPNCQPRVPPYVSSSAGRPSQGRGLAFRNPLANPQEEPPFRHRCLLL